MFCNKNQEGIWIKRYTLTYFNPDPSYKTLYDSNLFLGNWTFYYETDFYYKMVFITKQIYITKWFLLQDRFLLQN